MGVTAITMSYDDVKRVYEGLLVSACADGNCDATSADAKPLEESEYDKAENCLLAKSCLLATARFPINLITAMKAEDKNALSGGQHGMLKVDVFREKLFEVLKQMHPDQKEDCVVSSGYYSHDSACTFNRSTATFYLSDDFSVINTLVEEFKGFTKP